MRVIPMAVITLKQVYEDQKIKGCLLGRLFVDHSFRIGQLYFSDGSAQILCNFNSPLGRYQIDDPLYITKWTLSHMKIDQESKIILQLQEFNFSTRAFSLITTYDFSDFNIFNDEPIRDEGRSVDSLSVDGSISSKSNLFTTPSDIFFVLILRAHVTADQNVLDKKRLYIPLIIKGILSQSLKVVGLHEYLQVEKSYLFSKLSASKFRFDPSRDKVNGFCLNAFDGNVHLSSKAAPSTLKCQLLNQLSLSCQTQESTDKDIDEGDQIISYEGLITKIVDSKAGVYELDNEFQLYTTFYSGSEMILRKGAFIRMYNIHLNRYAPLERVFLLACPASTITLISDGQGQLELSSQKERLEVLAKWSGLNFMDILNRRLIANRLDKLSRMSSVEISRNYIIDKTLKYLGFESIRLSLVHGIIKHRKTCLFAKERYPSFTLTTVQEMRHLAQQFLESKSETSCCFQGERFCSQSLGPLKVCFLGLMRINSIGLVELVDETGNLPVIIENNRSNELVLYDQLCLITNFEVIVESVINFKKKIGHFIYLSLDSKDYIHFSEKIPVTSDFKLHGYFIVDFIRPCVLVKFGSNVKTNAIVEGRWFCIEKEKILDGSMIIQFGTEAMAHYKSLKLGSTHHIASEFGYETLSNGHHLLKCNYLWEMKIDLEPARQLFEARVVKIDSYSKIMNESRNLLAKNDLVVTSIQGLLVSKLAEPLDQDRHSSLHDIFYHYQTEMGSVALKDYRINFILQDESGSTLTVRGCSPSIILPLGLIPSIKIKVHDLGVCVDSIGNICCKLLPTSYIEIIQGFDPIQPIFVEPVHHFDLLVNQLVSAPHSQQLKFRCFINHVYSFSFHFICSNCNAPLVMMNCSNHCRNWEPKLYASATFGCDDGALLITLLAEGLDLVHQALKLSADDLSYICQQTFKKGIFSYNRSDSSNHLDESSLLYDDWLRRLVYQREIRVIGLIPRPIANMLHPNASLCINSREMINENFSVKDLDGQLILVANLKRLKIRAMSIQEANVISEAYTLLKEI